MTAKILSVSTRRMNETLGIVPGDINELDQALKDNGYLRLDVGYSPGNQIHYIKLPKECSDDKMIALLPTHSLLRMAITIASTMGTLTDHSAGQMIKRFSSTYGEARELLDLQIAFSQQNSHREYTQPIPESYNIKTDDLAQFAAWSTRIAPQITNQMMRRAADISTLPLATITDCLPPIVKISNDLSPDVVKSCKKGLTAPTAEIYQWLKLNPAVDPPRYERFTRMLGLDPNKAWQEVDDWMQKSPRT